jgi:hypothetical protein
MLLVAVGCNARPTIISNSDGHIIEDKVYENTDAEYDIDTQTNDDEVIVDSSESNSNKINLERLVGEEYQHLIPKGYLKDTYWTGDEVLDLALLTHIIIEDSNIAFKGLIRKDVAKEHLSEYMYSRFIGKSHSNEKEFTEEHILYLNSVIYDKYSITPFYTEFDDYIGIEYIVRIKGFKEYSDQEAYNLFHDYSGKYYVEDVYYHVNSDGDLELDKEGYYRRRYENTRYLSEIKMNEGDLIELNDYLDYSFDDYGSQPRNQYSKLGYTKWTDDEELNRALFAFIIDVTATVKRIRGEYINEFINHEDAEEMIEYNKDYISFEMLGSSASEIKIRPYEKDDIFVIEVIWGSESGEETESIENLSMQYYVHKQKDGKYKVLYDEEELDELL